jgi:hypothetical protein
MLLWKCNSGFCLHCCQVTKYSILLLTTVSTKQYECACIFALIIWHANRLFSLPYCVVFYGLSGLCFSTLSQMARFSEKKNYCTKSVCFDVLYNFYESFLIIRRIQWDIINYISLHVIWLLLLSDSNQTWILYRFSKNLQISNFMRICPLATELLFADRKTWQNKSRFL